jgi:alkaline phosphatase D
VVHVGDYIYETVADETFQGGGPPERQFTLPSGRNRAESLKDYRFLYKKYKSDEDLQYSHERYATINIWDDHELVNDCYQVYDSDTDNEQANRDPQRPQAANRAWAEYVPAGVPYQPKKEPLEEIHIYRSFEFGNLAELVMTDERLYRDGPPCASRQPTSTSRLAAAMKRRPDAPCSAKPRSSGFWIESPTPSGSGSSGATM